MQHRTGYARRTRAPNKSVNGSDTALHAKKQKTRSPYGTSGLLGEHLGIYKVLSEILGCRDVGS
jgi:hypothetical protein